MILYLALFACISFSKVIRIDYTLFNDNQVFQASVGDVVQVVLGSNPSTGYEWYLTNFDEVQSHFKALQMNQDFTGKFQRDNRRDPSGEQTGIGGVSIFELECLTPQSILNLNFVHKRPWEQFNMGQQQIRIMIQ